MDPVGGYWWPRHEGMGGRQFFGNSRSIVENACQLRPAGDAKHINLGTSGNYSVTVACTFDSDVFMHRPQILQTKGVTEEFKPIAARKQWGSIPEAVYWYNVTPKNGNLTV